jgi:hypothetical protein
MSDKSWRCRAIEMRLWATKVTDPYTKIEIMALADLYDRKGKTRRPTAPITRPRPYAIVSPLRTA